MIEIKIMDKENAEKWKKLKFLLGLTIFQMTSSLEFFLMYPRNTGIA